MSPADLTAIAACLLVAAIILLLLSLVAWRNAAKTSGRGRHAEGRPDEDIKELMSQLERLARRIDAQTEAQVGELRRHLEEADRKLDLLRRAAGEDRNGSTGVSRPDTKVRELHLRGLSSVEIARRLRIDVGEVELVLNLQRSAGAEEKVQR